MTYCTERFTRLDYCQFLLSSQINYSLTYAEHAKKWSHDPINRYLKDEKITPRLVWEKTRRRVEPSENGYVIFDDTVLDKNHSRQIEAVRRQWSGNAGGVIRGIGVVTCIYVNPDEDQFGIIDYRIEEISSDDPDCTDYIVTNDADQHSTGDPRKVCAVRWKVEEFHREAKQVTGIERCQCRSARAQRNHIGCAMLVWVRLKDIAQQTGQSIYRVTFGQLSDYLVQQLKSPSVQFS